MAADDLTGKLPLVPRDEAAARYRRDYQLRVPLADVGPNTQPDVDARVFADQQMIVMAAAQTISDGTNLESARGKQVDRIGEREGVRRPQATGASGFVKIIASIGGGTIFEGDELAPDSGLRFRCAVTAHYSGATPVPITGIDTGPATNLKPGTVLEWTNPRQGIGPQCTVLAQADGSGLSGGRNEATDVEYKALIVERRSNPPASGNDAEYQRAIEKTPGLAVRKAFTWPAIKGPGTIGVSFTLPPERPGGSRIPNPAQLGQVGANLEIVFPGDDGIFVVELLEQFVPVVLEVSWKKRAAGWADVSPWPTYLAGDLVRVNGAAAITATAFRLTTNTPTTAPQVGQTIGLYDAAQGKFRRKRFATVTEVIAGRSWTVTCVTTNNASDTTFVPAPGQIVSPWSESLDALVAPVVEYIDGMGPGEQVASFLDPGRRQRRQPENPEAWPSEITNRLIAPVQALPAVKDAVLLEPSVPFPTLVGIPGTVAYLIRLGDLAAFAQ